MSQIHAKLESPLLHIHLDPLPDLGGPKTSRYPKNEYAMFVVCGPDRVGIISGVTNWLSSHHVNIESGFATLMSDASDSPSVTLGAQYLVGAETAVMEGLRQALRSNDLPRPDQPATDPESEANTRPPLPYQLTIFADDGVGILARASRLLAWNGINIVTHTCQAIGGRRPGGLSRGGTGRGRGIFRLQMDVDVPPRGANDVVGRVQAGLDAFHLDYGWTAKFEERLTASRIKRAISGIAGCDPQKFATTSQN